MSTNDQKPVVRCLMMSLDGFAAGENQRLEQPFGDNVEGFTDWMFATRSGLEMLGMEGGEEGTARHAEHVAAEDDGKDVRLMGGAATIRQYLDAGLVDDLHLVLVPMLIGRGERVFPETSPPPGYTCVERDAPESVVHLRFERS